MNNCFICKRSDMNFRKAHKGQAFDRGDICVHCYHHMSQMVYRNRKRARKAGTESSLTIAQWNEILRLSNGSCHYCHIDIGLFHLTIDHVIPLAKGGGTTAQNTVAACERCNTKKHIQDADKWRGAVQI